MEVKQVKIGRVSNKAFLLFVVDAMNATCGKDLNENYTIDIVSETMVDVFCEGESNDKCLLMKHKISFSYEYDCVDIRIYLLNIKFNGEVIPLHMIKQIVKLRNGVDGFLLTEVEKAQNQLLSFAPNIQNYENMVYALSDDSIYDGTLFDVLPSINTPLYISVKPQYTNQDVNAPILYQPRKQGADIGAIENMIGLPFYKVIRLKSIEYSYRRYFYLSSKGVFEDRHGALFGEMKVDGSTLVYEKKVGYSCRYMRISNTSGKIVVVSGDDRIKLEESYIVEAIIDPKDIATSKEIFTNNSRKLIEEGVAAVEKGL